MDMCATAYKAMELSDLRDLYSSYLTEQGLSKSTVSTTLSDTFYLWRRVNREAFWQVLESSSFETDAKIALTSALRANSNGAVDALISGYMAHLRRFRRFIGWEIKSTAEIADKQSNDRHGICTVRIPTPSSEQVADYLRRWDETESYYLQECTLNRLFHRLCPANTAIEDILLKASALNDFYGTNIYSIFPVAKHILDLGIDERLASGDLSLVDDLKTVVIGGKTRHLYSFASKYCSHHNEADFPIYDSYVDAVLRHFRAIDRFECFTNDDLKIYPRFKAILAAFQSYYDLNQFSLKEIDQYIWQLGKDYLPKSF